MLKLIQAPTLDDALSALSALARDNEKNGRRTLVFCEDRLTLLAERAVLAGTGGTFLTEVSTFARFLEEKKALSKQGSVMAVAALLEKHADELRCFRKGAAQAVYETLAQLSASRVDAETLKRSAEETEGMLRLKLLDLSFLLERYGEFLREKGLLDETGYLALLPEKIERGALRDTDAVFFAFPSFTKQGREGLCAAMEYARSTTGIFLAGERNWYTNEAARAFRALAARFGGAEEQKLPLTLQGDALLLHEALFSPEWREPVPAQNVVAFSAADEAGEAYAVAALVKKYVAEGKRYRDLAVLAGGEEYFLAVGKAFDAFRIPYYADRKRAFSEHPFCAFALSVLQAVQDGVLPEEADDIAASVYFGGGEEYRNYLLRFGAYRGAVRREIRGAESLGGADRETLVRARERMLSYLKLFRAKDRAGAYAEGIRKLWEAADGERVTEGLKRKLSGEEGEFLDISRLWKALDETETVAGEGTFTAREFAALLESGLSAMEVSLFPRRADAVFVGDITESRIYRSPVLFCIGITDELPRVSQDTAVISDGEIARLASLGAEIEPAIAQVNARARESLALNLTAFGETLYVSTPARRGESETSPGEIFLYLRRAFRPASLPDLFPYDCCEAGPALLRFFALLDELGNGKNAAETIARYSSLRQVLLSSDRGTDPDALRAGAEKPRVPEAGELYFARDFSPTLLETYFDCPYKSFAMRALRLSDREERGAVDAADAGTFVHTVLKRTARLFNELESAEACVATAKKEAEALLASPMFSALADTAAGGYAGARLIEEAAAVTAAAYRQLACSEFRVRETEAGIRLPALKLSGKADRVDEADGFVRVIDYKTGSFDDSPTAYYTGRKLQLQLYLRAASAEGRAAGAFYFPAADDFTGADAEGKFRMKGFFCSDEEVLSRMDKTRAEGGKSEFYEGGGRTEKGMDRARFEEFLSYAELVSAGAEREMRKGNVRPSPYEGACEYCKLKGACGFVGAVRKEPSARCAEIAEIAEIAEREERE